MTIPKVFLSHAHSDREEASYLDKLLRDNGAKTFLDQRDVEVGDNLPDRIVSGIKWCDLLLLVWSKKSERSSWVRKEWNLAYDERKKIVPYLLESIDLPPPLENIVHVERGDRDRSHAGLFRAIFGRDYIPSTQKVFPGQWRGATDALGMTTVYEVELRPNGQIVGTCKSEGGTLNMIQQLAGPMAASLSNAFPVHGSWTYDERMNLLTLNVTAEAFGQSRSTTITIHASSGKGGRKATLAGAGSHGEQWRWQRVGKFR